MKLNNILILGGGDGTRFWPLLEKNTTSFLNIPLVLHVLRSVSNYADKITVVTNPDNDGIIKNAIGKDMQTVVVRDPSASNMGKAVLECEGKIQGGVLVLNAVDIIDFAVINQFIDTLSHEKKEYMFLGKEIYEYFPGAYAVFEGETVKSFIEKPDPNNIPSHLAKLVCDYFSDFDRLVAVLKSIRTKRDDLYEQAINAYMTQYPVVGFVAYEGYWLTLKYPWHVLSMMSHFLHTLKDNHIGKNVHIAKNAVIIPPVYIADNVKIGDFVKIKGPTYIGESSVIGDHSLVRESHIGRNVLVGGGCEVVRSYVDSNVMLHRDYVGDSVLDEGVLLGSGVVTANFRFDTGKVASKSGDIKIDTGMEKFGAVVGKKSKIGVNATILPGVKIGKGTFVMPGEVVESDISDNRFLHQNKTEPNKHSPK